MVSYETVYAGGDDNLNANYSIYQPITYQEAAKNIGLTLDGRTANQLKEIAVKANAGVKNIEVSGAMSKAFDAIPEQHFKEMSRAMKIAGISPSLHAPVVEASGMTQQGWEEGERVGAERQLASALIKGHALDPKGNISVTTHSTAILPEMEQITKIKGEAKLGKVFVVNPRTGEWGAIKAKKRFFPKKGEFIPEGREAGITEELEEHNKNQWIQNLSGINRFTNYGEEIISNTLRGISRDHKMNYEESRNFLQGIAKPDMESEHLAEALGVNKPEIKKIQQDINHGHMYLRDAYQNLKQMFDLVYEKASDKDKQLLKGFAQESAPIVQEDIENNPRKIEEFGKMIEKGLKVLGKVETPETVVPLKKFVLDKSSETFANAATTAYNKFGDTAPILNIENPPAGGGLSKAEDLRELIRESRKKMADNLIKEKGLSTGEAKKVSEKMIGATWDVGHINMLRKKGYSEEDIVKQTEIIAPYVKHVHLSDNFGYEHTELPMGMGNVPIKKMMERLGEKGFDKKKIVEAMDWYEHFQDAPGAPPKWGGHALPQTMQAFGSPVYTTGVGMNWAQVPGFAAYTTAAGQGAIAPPVSQAMYGTAFSTLPQDLGGPVGGEQSRFSGTPNQ